MKKVRRKIITIEEERCNGCGVCIISCPEQAIQIVNTKEGPKAKLVKEFYCDGLGACLGSCPTGALTIEEKEVEPYDEEATIARIKETAPHMLEIHLKHLKEHADELPQYHSHKMLQGITSCPSAKMLHWTEKDEVSNEAVKFKSELRQWPIQLHLVSPSASYFQDADLILVADCVPFAYPNFHADFLKGKAIAIGCPKLDDVDAHLDKIEQIIRNATIKSLKVVNMEVPCCFGLYHLAKTALAQSNKNIALEQEVISIKGERK